MSTTAMLFTLLIATALIAAVAILTAWHFMREVERLTGEHAARERVRAARHDVTRAMRKVPAFQPHKGRHTAVPAPRPRLPITQRPIKREYAPGRPPWFTETAPIPAVRDVPALAAAPEPTDEQTHDLYFGGACEAEVLAAEAGAQMARQP